MKMKRKLWHNVENFAVFFVPTLPASACTGMPAQWWIVRPSIKAAMEFWNARKTKHGQKRNVEYDDEEFI